MPGIEAYEYHVDIVVMINILMLAAFIYLYILVAHTNILANIQTLIYTERDEYTI